MFRFQTRINSASSTLTRRTSLLAAIATIGTVALSLGTASPASAGIRTCNRYGVSGCYALPGQCTRMTDYYGGTAIYDDGDEATTSSGRKIVCRNGQWYYARITTAPPSSTTAPLAPSIKTASPQ